MLHQHPMFVTYIVYSPKLDRYYIGHTSDLEKRLAEHNAGISTFTSKTTDWVLKFSKSFDSRTDAFKFEMAIKKKKSRKYILFLIEAG